MNGSIVSEIIQDIEYMITQGDTEYVFLSTHILNKVVQLSKSEYGFLAVLKRKDGNTFLQNWAISLTAWNEATYSIYTKHQHKEGFNFSLEHDTLFKKVVTTNDVVIENDYSSRATHFQPSGHPEMKRFMGVPIQVSEILIGMVGVANKLLPYTPEDAEHVAQLLRHFAFLFVNMGPEPSVA